MAGSARSSTRVGRPCGSTAPRGSRARGRTAGIPLRFVGGDTDPFFGNVRAGFEGTGRLDRREWGITWNTPPDSGGLLVSDRIHLEFELSLIEQG